MHHIYGRWHTALVIVAVAAGVATASSPHVLAQRETRQRHVIVSVTDKGDRPVDGLTDKDFVVREDNVARELLSVKPAPAATHLVLLVDDSQATQPLTIELRAALKTFLGQMLTEGRATAVRLATFGERPTTRAEFTTSLGALNIAIDRIVPKTGAGSTLLEAIVETCRDLRTRSAERPVIVAFVEEHGPEFGNESHTQVADALKSVHAPLWTLVLQDPAATELSDAGRERTQVLTDVAARSGGYGKTFLSKQGIEPAFKALASLMTKQYDLTYSRPDSLIPPKQIDVQTRDRALRVLAPRWTGQ